MIKKIKNIKTKLPTYLVTVTPFSKALALVLFIALPFIGFYFGIRYEKTNPNSSLLDQSTVQITTTPAPTGTNLTPTPNNEGENIIEGSFCGGIGANLSQNQCPPNYYCKKDGVYPDAGGVCVKN